MGSEGSGLLAMLLGAALLLYGLCCVSSSHAAPKRHRRGRLSLLGGGSLFVLGVLFVCCPQPWGTTLLLIWSISTVVGLIAHELLCAR